MNFYGDRQTAMELIQNLADLASKNPAFAYLYTNPACNDIAVIVGDEGALLKDSHNTSKTLTEFRAYNCGRWIYLFSTRYETPQSLVNSFLHEFCHTILRGSQITSALLDIAMRGSIPDIKADMSSAEIEAITKQDNAHEQLPEELLCDDVAMALTGRKYDRTWWRKNIIAVDTLSRKSTQ